MKNLLTGLLSLFVVNMAIAQGTFTADPVKYLDNVKSYLGQYDKKMAKDFTEAFEPVWLSIPETVKGQVYQMSNELAAMNVRPYPEFMGYLTGIKVMAEKNLLVSVYPEWKDAIQQCMKAREKKQLPEFLTYSMNFFGEDVIYKTNSLEWKALNSSYKFGYEKTPVITFEKATLVCYAKNDTSTVFDTKGTLLPLKEIFRGKGGKVTWERAKLPANETWADLNNYEITLRSTGFDADSVLFHTPYFKTPLSGKLLEKITSQPKTRAATYPQFQSYSKRLFIKNIFPNVDYDGGFSMQGASLMGFGAIGEEAQIYLYRKDKRFMRIHSLSFTIKKDVVDSDRAGAVIYIAQDSISHPYLRFKYQQKDNQVILSRNKDGLSQSPFFNTYHKLEMYFEALYWRLDDPVVEMGPMFGSTEKTARFESTNYFSVSKYNELQGMDQVHPMIPIDQLALRKDTNLLSLSDVASFMGRPEDQIIGVIGALSNGGFISYDPDTRMITVKKKLKTYLQARAKKVDYDPIDFDSEVQGTTMNATLNLLNYEMIIRGVKRVTLSDSQFVKVYPENQEIIVQKDRDMKFGGIVNIGRTEFFGKQFFFAYEDFRVDLIDCDSMRLRVWPWVGPANRQVRVKSTIRNVQGSVTLDGKGNKSGVKRGFEKYPILNSTKHTYVFYNDRDIYRGVYDSAKFFFKIDPFVMDSLDNFNTPTQKFPGEFHSAGILPMIREELSVQEDYSLGFIRKAPPEGLKLYGDKAVFNNTIRLNWKGLQADGKVNYLTAIAESDAFTLFPDSLTGITTTYTNKEQKANPNVPQVVGKGAFVRFLPKQKVLYAESRDSLLNFFNSEARMRGTCALRPEGMTGSGKMYFRKAEMFSKNYKYKARVIDSDTAAFKLRDYTGEDNAVALKTDNVNAHIDFDQRVGEFKSNGTETHVEFPENQYICYMDRFKWFMDSQDIQLESDKKAQSGDIAIDTDLDLSGSNFFSIHPEQDSLNFMAPKARYDLKKKEITCKEVNFINIADARIFPDSQRIVIQKKAKIDPLKNAKIIANYITKYHTIYNARVEIKARRLYQAEGDYSYIDENQAEQKIHFANITLDSTLQTYAKGEVKEEERFMLSPHFEYKGGVILKAADKGLNFDGGVRLVHKCPGIDMNWLSFKAVVDPMDIRIPVGEELVNYETGVLGAGVTMNSDSISIYPSFLSSKLNKAHPDVADAHGYLVFDKKNQQYQIATDEKLKERMLPGNFVALSKEKCEIEADGKLSFGADLGQLQVVPIGTMKQTLSDNKLTMQVSLMVSFPFVDNALEKMADKIINYPDLLAFDYSKSNYEKALRELVGLEKADKVVSDLSLHGEVKKFPDELANAIVFADVKFRWIPEQNAFVSDGMLGLSNVLKNQVFKYVDGRIKIEKTRTGDIFSMIIRLDDSKWYFFTYSNKLELMEVCTTDDAFKSVVEETKDDKRKYKGEKGQKDFEFRYNQNKRSAANNLILGE